MLNRTVDDDDGNTLLNRFVFDRFNDEYRFRFRFFDDNVESESPFKFNGNRYK